jgi:DNA replication protein DnaC
MSKCETCGKEHKPIYVKCLDKYITPVCDQVIEERRRQDEEARQKEKQAAINRIFRQSGIEERQRSCNFPNWQKRPGTENAFEAAKRFCSTFNAGPPSADRPKPWLLIFGEPGNGKTHLAAAICNYLMKQGTTVIFSKTPRLLRQIRDTYGRTSQHTEQDIFQQLLKTDLLVLDDCGSEKLTEWTEPTLNSIIDERYDRLKPMIFTTNTSLEELERRIGTRAMDRIIEMAELVENKGTSYRKEIARQRIKGT